MGNYTAQYGADDLDDISIDLIGGFGVGIIAFISLIGLAILAIWGLRSWRRHKP